MIRVNQGQLDLKRTIRPLFANTQATPVGSTLLDPAWDRSVDIYPGMALMKTSGDQVTLLNGTGIPYGLSGLFIAPGMPGGGIDEVALSGVNSLPVWVLGPDSQFLISAPAFDSTASWVDPGDGTIALVYAYTTGAKRGQLCPAGAAGASTVPVARLMAVVSSTQIKIGGLTGRVA